MTQSFNNEAYMPTMGVGFNNSHWSQINDMHLDDHEFEVDEDGEGIVDAPKGRGGNYTNEEDVLLCNTWLQVSRDPSVGDCQKWVAAQMAVDKLNSSGINDEDRRDGMDDLDMSNKHMQTIDLDEEEEEASSDDGKRSPTPNSVSYSKPKRLDVCKKDAKEKKKRKRDDELKNAMKTIVKGRKEANEVRKMARNQDAAAEERKVTLEERKPWEAYTSDTTIDLSKHHKPKVLLDKIAYWTVKSLRVPTDIFFQRRYGCRAMMLETVAAVPGMVGGMLLHLRSLRRFEQSGGWIRALLEEAENERMHLMTFMEVANPKWYERALVLAVQGVFFNAYFLGYIVSPKFAHRVVGYLEEEAIHSYTEFLRDLEAGRIENVPAPRIAIDYWRLPADARLKDVVTVVRADEAHHRDVNHFAADIHFQGLELNKTPAPLGYH
ncbi:Alternative oxidase 1a, mitochondrial [Triticum urartu]|uniref:Ubiquinol oxidase n=1 Tax=Triticum urartu TaxID=4572 RepID=M7Z9T3_TRIUA|nr:Alternative oxidase 1a, mitochondrial [Triticum urartu]